MMNRWMLVLPAAGLAVLLWVWWKPGPSPGSSPRPRPSIEVSTIPAHAQARAVLPRTPVPSSLRRAALETPAIPDEPHLDEAQEARPPSHPLTEEHRKIQHELDLLRRLDDAYDGGDHETMRALLEVYRNHHADDVHAMQSGYAVLADCLDPSRANDQATIVRAQAYYEDERASTLRRYVRRSCLEP